MTAVNYSINPNNIQYPIILEEFNLSIAQIPPRGNGEGLEGVTRAGGIDDLLRSFKAGLYTYDKPLHIVLICAYVPVFLLALVGNILVLLTVLGSRKMRNSTNYFLLNLALADLLVTLICMPLTLCELIYRGWIYGEFLCKIAGYLPGVTFSASVFTIMALSLERYLAIRHPLVSRRAFTETRVKACVLLIWLTSCGLIIPVALVRRLDQYPVSAVERVPFCLEKWPRPGEDRFIFDLSLFIVTYIIPGSVVLYSYVLTGRRLLTRDRSLGSQSSDVRAEEDSVMVGRRRVAVMLMVLAGLFAVSWLPYHVICLYLDFLYKNDAGTEVSLGILYFSLLLGHSHSAQNPIIYASMSPSFKRGMAAALMCREGAPRTGDTIDKAFSVRERNNSRRLSARPRPLALQHESIRRHQSSTLNPRSASVRSALTGSSNPVSPCSPRQIQYNTIIELQPRLEVVIRRVSVTSV